MSIDYDKFIATRKVIQKYVDFENKELYDLCAIYSISTHFYTQFNTFPYMFFLGQGACGKSRAAKTTGLCSKRPFFTVRISRAALLRELENDSDTIVFEDYGRWPREEKRDFDAVFLNGYSAGQKYALTIPGKDDFTVKKFDVYGPKIFSSRMKESPDVMERCLVVHMAESEDKKIVNLPPPKDGKEFEGVRNYWETSAIAGMSHVKDIIGNEMISDEIIGRNRELWLPLLTVARLIGENVYETILKLAKEHQTQAKIERSSDLELAIVSWMLSTSQTTTEYYQKVCRDAIIEDFQKITSRAIGRVFEQFGLMRGPRRSEGVVFIDNKNVRKKLAKRFEGLIQ